VEDYVDVFGGVVDVCFVVYVVDVEVYMFVIEVMMYVVLFGFVVVEDVDLCDVVL